VSKADQLADDAAALTPLQATSAAKATLVKPSGQDEAMPAGTAWSWPHIQSCCCSNHTVASELQVTPKHGVQQYKGTKVQEGYKGFSKLIGWDSEIPFPARKQNILQYNTFSFFIIHLRSSS